MTDVLDTLTPLGPFDAFDYRLLYLRPTPYADEQIVVGLVAASQGRLETRFIAAPAALELMGRVLGDDGVEQFQFAAAEMRRMVSGLTNLDMLNSPSDLLMAGEKQAAVTRDRNGLLTSILASASCLVRSGAPRSADALTAPATLQFSRDLREQVLRLSPLTADRIFDCRVMIDAGLVVIPILGNKIFGAPVSLVVKDQRIRAEAYVAQFRWLRRHLPQQPRVYLLAPTEAEGRTSTRLDFSLRELRAVAQASDVPLRFSESTEEMATLILQDEAA